MRPGPAGRNATLAVIGVFALVGFLAGTHAHPAPVSAGYCDDYPELCTTFTVAATGTGSGTVTTADGSINCHYSAPRDPRQLRARALPPRA